MTKKLLAILFLATLSLTWAQEFRSTGQNLPGLNRAGLGSVNDMDAQSQFGDYDGDGDIDLFMAGSDSRPYLRLYRNDAGKLVKVDEFPNLYYPNFSAFADFNKDGKWEILHDGEVLDSVEEWQVNTEWIYDELTGESFEKIIDSTLVKVADYSTQRDEFRLLTYNSATKKFDSFSPPNSLPKRIMRNMKSLVFDADGDAILDLMVFGLRRTPQDDNLRPFLELYHNLGENGTYKVSSTELPGLFAGDIQVADMDLDGDLDLFIAGDTATQIRFSENSPKLIAALYRNDGGNFTFWQDFYGLAMPKVALGDLNGDKYPEIIVTGWRLGVPDNTPQTDVYRLGHGSYVSMDIALPDVADGWVDIADADGDGLRDILLSGEFGSFAGHSEGRRTTIFRNFGKGEFRDLNSNLPALRYSQAMFHDFDRDGRLDIFTSGIMEPMDKTAEIHQNVSGHGKTDTVSQLVKRGSGCSICRSRW